MQRTHLVTKTGRWSLGLGIRSESVVCYGTETSCLVEKKRKQKHSLWEVVLRCEERAILAPAPPPLPHLPHLDPRKCLDRPPREESLSSRKVSCWLLSDSNAKWNERASESV
ncbi:hypothetical protein CEXT_39021 [Caerostris extrusa]|uniref:Uncharacterized protein n=1 Tax=Caerostris extrusa TaxID=172846 RepID=A0AAV4UIE0_CAEEX|nr:hypothetical protein CEXT_39021 [Caerostris extrusa]